MGGAVGLLYFIGVVLLAVMEVKIELALAPQLIA